MKIFLHNSLSGRLDEFIPIDEKNVRMYACGPTVYDTPHIGNARPLVVFDVLFRLLESIYPTVTYVRNITDVDDKINNKARQLGINIRSLTDNVIKQFHEYLAVLNIKNVSYEPRATDHINEMIDIIKVLLDNGFAYQADGHVLYRVRNNDQYGTLSKRSLDDMIAGNRVDIAPYKEDPMDFVLWKPSDEGQPAWDSPFGRGRPGWHIECSAMSNKFLGQSFDIHAGGHDLKFPHHENEMAQNYGAFGCKMANYWLHNGMLLVNGRKMSKSEGNVIKLDELLQKANGEVVRYALLSAHYQKTLDWSESIISDSKTALDRLYNALDGDVSEDIKFDIDQSHVAAALCNNLNTPLALRSLHSIADEIFSNEKEIKKAQLRKKLINEGTLLGLFVKKPKEWFRGGISSDKEQAIIALIQERKSAKDERNFAKADEIRDKLFRMGVILKDKKDGTTSWECG